MRKFIKYSIAMGAGLLAVTSLASCNDESSKYADYEVTDNNVKYNFKIYDAQMDVVVETTTETENTETGTDTTTTETVISTSEKDAGEEAAKNTEGRQVVLSKLVSNDVETVTVPSVVTINGLTYTVTKIGAGSFLGMSKVKTVTIPNTVSQIYDKAFQYCTSLQTINYKGDITEVGSNLYTGSTFISTITYEGTTLLNGITGGIKTLKVLNLPNVTTLGEKSIYFNGDSYLEQINFGSGKLTTIKKNAISNITRPNGLKVFTKTAWDTFKGIVTGSYYTLDANGYTYTKVDTASVKAPVEGVTYYKAGSPATINFSLIPGEVTGSAAAAVTINETSSSSLTTSAQYIINAIASGSTITYVK